MRLNATAPISRLDFTLTMSSVDGPKAGSQDIGEALVAALGFEPTTGSATTIGDSTLEGQPDIIWSDDELGGATDRRSLGGQHQSQEPIVVADGESSGSSPASTSTEVADSSMSPAKGKGKGPRKISPRDTSSDPGKKNSPKQGDSQANAPASKDPGSKSSASTGSSSVDPSGNGVAGAEESDLDLFDQTVEVPHGAVGAATGLVADPDATGPMKKVPLADIGSALDETGPMKVSSTEPTELATNVPEVTAENEAVPGAETIVVENGIPMVANQVITNGPPPPLLEEPTGPPVLDGQPPGPPGFVAPPAEPSPPGLVNGKAGSGLSVSVPEILDRSIFQRKKRVQARKVRRVVRHIDPWSVLTFSVLFFLCLYAALLLSSVLVWNAAVAAGTIEKIESFIRELGDYQTYEIDGDVVFRATMIIAGVLTLASSVLVVLLSVVFNLISDLIGGIRLTVIEEETVRVSGE